MPKSLRHRNRGAGFSRCAAKCARVDPFASKESGLCSSSSKNHIKRVLVLGLSVCEKKEEIELLSE